MKALKDKYSNLITVMGRDPETEKEIPIPGVPKFKRFSAGIGWLDDSGHEDYAKHAFVVIGEQEDGCYAAFAEYSSEHVGMLATELTNWKDMLLVDRAFVDFRDWELCQSLRTHDGLTRYFQDENAMGILQYVHSDEHWPHFRERDITLSLLPFSDLVTANWGSGYDLMRMMSGQGKFHILDECPGLKRVMRQQPPLKDIFRHPLLKAAGGCLTMMEKLKPRPAVKEKMVPVAYGGLR